MPWTTEQLDAIGYEGNLIVSAAAGAGKTAVLTERIVQRVQSGTSILNMLVLTFTRAAAAEMKSRIGARLTALVESAGDQRERLYLLHELNNVGSAYISTVHAFCARVLRRHYHRIGIAPDARVIDETETAVLVSTVKDALLTELAANDDPDWRRLLAAFGGEDAAWDAVMQTEAFLSSQPDGKAWLNDAVLRYDGDRADALLNEVLESEKHTLLLALDALVTARNDLPIAENMEKAFGVLDDTITRVRALVSVSDYDAFREGLCDMEYGRLNFPRDFANAEKQPVRDARDALKALVAAQKKRLARPYQKERETLSLCAPVLFALERTVNRFTDAFDEEKRRRNTLDFSDLEHLALRLLEQPDVAAEYRNKFSYIAVDEYQDSNRVQEAIVNAIRRENNLFLVGDVKQSIYRFRQAEPALFLEKLTAFSGDRGKRIDLLCNFRSSKSVLSAVNDTFYAIMSRDAGEMDYDAKSALRYAGDLPEGCAELHIISRDTDTEAEGDDALEAAADAEVEARFVAEKIQSLSETECVLDRSTGLLRKPVYSDYAILLRSTTHAQLVAQTLSQCGVPCYAQLTGGYFEALEVQIFLNLLRVIDNRRQDVPLISVLLSGVGDFSVQELMEIRCAHRAGTFFDACNASLEHNAKLSAFFDRLEEWRRESLVCSAEELIGSLLDTTGFFEQMGAGAGGAQRQANLEALINKAHLYAQSGGAGLYGFLTHMDLARSGASVGAVQIAGASVVRILTIHKSKGLEFPIVFVLQLGSKFNLSAGSNTLNLHDKRGIGLKLLSPNERVFHDTAVRQSIVERMRFEQLSEEMRVLYVALTRAKSHLFCVGCMHAPEEQLSKAAVNPSPYAVLRAGTPLKWLLSGKRSSMTVTLHPREQYLEAPQAQKTPSLPEPNEALLDALATRLAWQYPFSSAVQLPAKASVSRVAASGAMLPLVSEDGGSLGKFSARMPSFDVPAFLKSDEVTPTFLGTAAHTAMQYLPLDTPLRADAAPAYIESLFATRRMTQQQAEVLPVDWVQFFVETPYYQSMCASNRVERELSFTYAASAATLFQTDAQEQILIQGVIDCCYEENGAWVLLDYKSDRIRPGETAESTAMLHRAQLELYAAALQALTGMEVIKLYVVMLREKTVVQL